MCSGCSFLWTSTCAFTMICIFWNRCWDADSHHPHPFCSPQLTFGYLPFCHRPCRFSIFALCRVCFPCFILFFSRPSQQHFKKCDFFSRLSGVHRYCILSSFDLCPWRCSLMKVTAFPQLCSTCSFSYSQRLELCFQLLDCVHVALSMAITFALHFTCRSFLSFVLFSVGLIFCNMSLLLAATTFTTKFSFILVVL